MQVQPSQTLRAAVLGVCMAVWLALLPLQAWAQTAMPWTALGQTAAVEAPPCHAVDEPAPAHPLGCADCALCQLLAAPAPLPLGAALALAATLCHDGGVQAAPPPGLDPPFKPHRA
jgi:hypothetical protein